MPSKESGLKTRQLLIDAAQDFLGQGNNEVSIQDVAKRAGVAVGSVYTHFSDRRHLFETAAADALINGTPKLAQIATGLEDPALGFLASSLYACSRYQFDPKTTRIILTVGPIGFVNLEQYFKAPAELIQMSVDKGWAKCDDPEAFVMAASGAYQNLLAHYFAGTASPKIGERVFLMFAQMLGYSDKDFQKVVKYVASIKD